jgi:hypothetical protein
MKSYLEKNNLHYFTFFPNSEKSIRELIRHVLPDTPAEDISNSLKDTGFNVIKEKQLTAIRKAPNGQALPLFLVTLTRNIISKDIYRLNSLIHIIAACRLTTGISELKRKSIDR